MINKEIIINKKTRKIVNGENGDLFKLGVDGENLQENIIFKFEDEFVNGTARIEITMQDNTKSYVMINKVNETYILPVKSILTKKGLNKMQLVITQGTDDEEIPIFKSEMFNFFIAESINADTEQPEEYPQWIDRANTTLNEIDNFDIDAIKELNEATITITDRYGLSKSVQVFDGENGQDGKDAKINGVNTLRLLAGNNITIEQEDDELTINAEGGSSGAVSSVNGMTGDVIIEIPDVSDFITKDVDDLTYYEPKSTTANNLVASIDSSTYVMTLTLRNSNNDTLSTQSIDLPLETMVVDGEYDSTNKKIILTLKNGNTIEFSVADLVSGLQSEITSSNKLDADLVDDSNSTNKFTNATEKATWNAKSDFSGDYEDLTNKPTIYKMLTLTNSTIDFPAMEKGYYIDPDLHKTRYIYYTINNTQKTLTLDNNTEYVYGFYVFKTIDEIVSTGTAEERQFAYIYYRVNDGEKKYAPLYYNYSNGEIDNVAIGTKTKYEDVLTTSNQTFYGYKTYYNGAFQRASAPTTYDDQLTPKKYVDEQVAKKTIQYSTMPTASSSYLDKIIQYIGTTDSTYTNGYFYKCVSDGEQTPTYSWENVNVQQGSQSLGEDVYYINITSSSKPFIFDGKKKGFYIQLGYSTKFYYKLYENDSVRLYNNAYVYQLYLKNDFNYIEGETTYPNLGAMLYYDLSSPNNDLRTTIELNINGGQMQGSSSYVGTLLNSSSQSIKGLKTFNTIPQQSNTNAPTNNAEFTNKKYVDDSINNAIGSINTILATLTTPSNNS